MISVVKVFNTIRDLCNEDQRGFVTPEVFNSFAEVAQEAVYERMRDAYLNTARLKRSNMDLGGVDSEARAIKDNLSDYLDEVVIDTTGDNSFDRSVFKKPSDLDRIVSIETFDGDRDDIVGGYPCDLVFDIDKVSMLQRSNLSSPTEEYPVAIVMNDIEVIPTPTSSIKIVYYRRPSSRYVTKVGRTSPGDLDRGTPPRYAVSTANQAIGLYILDSSNTRDFDLPKEYYKDLVDEISSMMGVRLRDPLISNYAAQQQAKA